jgi:hypothetical protein
MMDNVREKLVELFDEAARICNNQDCRACGYFREANCINKTIIDRLIANGVTVQEWIPVSERLPEDGVQVLACTKHGKAFSAHCERGRFRVSGSVTVTHWMPLPQPPKGE